MHQNSDRAFRANRIFVDRVEPTAIVNSTCRNILDGDIQKEIFVFYGYGGIGKSKFFEELQKNLSYKDSFNIIRINLNVYEYNNVMSILLAIRRCIDIDCPEFDYATVRYYNKCHLPLSQLNEQLKNAKSTIFDVLKEIGKECADIVIPGFSYLEKAANLLPKIKDAVVKLKSEHDYKYIDELDAIDILHRLPVYLADGINKCSKIPIIIFDDYESMRNKLEGGSLCDNCDDWIFSFIRSINKGLFLFSSREKMNWGAGKCGDTAVEQYYLERLSDKDSYTFLKGVPIDNEKYIKDIMSVAQGVPIYLDMCVDLYENHVKSSSSSFDLTNVDGESITDRYLAHLSKAQIELVHILAHFQIFDIALLRYIIKQINLSIDELELQSLLEKCIFDSLDDRTYKLDGSIQKQLLLLQEKNIEEICINLLLKCLSNDGLVCAEDRLFHYESLCNLISSRKDPLDKKQQELLFICVNRVLDAGYWTSLDGLTSMYLSDDEYHHLLLYIRAQREKREGNLQDALLLAEEIAIDAKAFGNYRFAPLLLKTQIIHLLGDYDGAVKGYKEVVDKIELFDLEEKDEKSYVLAQLKLADVNFLNGRFVKAKKSLKAIKFEEDKSLEIEYLRIKAHIHRFNLDFENAKELYESGLEACETNTKPHGMLLNNLAEIYCIREPELAIKYGQRAIKENGLLNANIEIGKTHAALSVAYARLGYYDEALRHANESVDLQTKTGYKSGILFGYFALCYSHYKAGKRDEYDMCLAAMKNLYEEIGTYEYVVRFAEYLYSGSFNTDGIDWLDEDEMNERVRILL